MTFRDRDWYVNALHRARVRVVDLQTRISRHIESDEFDSAKSLLADFDSALTDANNIANQFADKFGG